MSTDLFSGSLLEDSLFPGLTHCGIDWRSLVKSSPQLLSQYRDYLQTKQDYIFINMDYSSLEVYVQASISKDQKMINLVNNRLDFHSENAKSIFGIDYKDLERRLALNPHDPALIQEYELFLTKRKSVKSLTFSLSYGAGPEKIAMDQKITVDEANKLIRDFYNTYPDVERWQNETFLFAIQNGYIETPFGRRRSIPRIKGRMDAYKAFIEEDKKAISALKRSGEYWSLRSDLKTCKNTPIQSVASDMCSVAAFKFKNWIRKNNKRARMMFWVHDAIAFWVHIDDAIETIQACSDIMCNKVKYNGDPVNYNTSLDIGYNYEFMTEIKHFEPTKEFLLEKLQDSLEKDVKKKFKLLVKTMSLTLDNSYVSSLRNTKEDYYNKLVEKLNIPNVYTVDEYMAYCNNVSVEDWIEYRDSLDSEETDVE